MIPCRALIRKHLSLLKPGEIFTTRDLLSYGRRSAVDKTLCLMVQAGYLTRLAFGVFVITHTSKPFYTVAEIVQRKALAFGKTLYTHASNFKVNRGWRVNIKFRSAKVVQDDISAPEVVSSTTEKSQALTLRPPHREPEDNAESQTDQQQYPFSCSTSSSSFRFRCGLSRKIKLAMVRYCCTKLLKHGDTNVGLTIRGLVAIGPQNIDDDIVQDAVNQLHYKERAELRMANARMPHWLSDRLITAQSAIAAVLRFQTERAASNS